MAPAKIPESYIDLIDGTYDAMLSTVMPNGQPQTTPVWLNREGDHLCINTMKSFRKAKNMRLNPRVTLLVYDPANPLRNIEIRGEVVEMIEENAIVHLDLLTSLYMKQPGAHFFGDCVAIEEAAYKTPIKVKIMPLRIRVEG